MVILLLLVSSIHLVDEAADVSLLTQKLILHHWNHHGLSLPELGFRKQAKRSLWHKPWV